MSATIKLTGALRSYQNGQAVVNAPAGRTVRETLVTLNIPPEIIALVQLNDRVESKDYRLQENDQVLLLAVIGGG